MSAATRARIDAGFTIEEAAKRARVCVPYLRRIELNGGAPYVLATRLARIYGYRLDVFLLEGKVTGRPQRTTRSRKAPQTGQSTTSTSSSTI